MQSIRTRRRSRRLVLAVLCALLPGARALASNEACEASPSTRPPAFVLKFGDEVSALALVSTSLLPGAELELEALGGEPVLFEAAADGGDLERVAGHRWRWRAPAEPGTTTLRVADGISRSAACLRIFVLRPYAGEDTVDGFRIGAYPPGTPPAGLIRVDAGMLELPVSPHFRLRQFLAKQEGGFPKYLALRTRLLLALEAIAAQLAERGAPPLAVMSGYRTPYYNAKIGNLTTASRHLFGDAADLYLDGDGDGRMDDLDGDGRSTDADAQLLYRWVDEMSAQPWYQPFAGGLALYPAAPHRGPMIHVDVRGRAVRW